LLLRFITLFLRAQTDLGFQTDWAVSDLNLLSLGG
jgi:hypothetical protein